MASEVRANSNVCKLLPAARLPARNTLQHFSAADVRLLKRRLIEPIECVLDPSFEHRTAEAEYARPLETFIVVVRDSARNDDSGVDLLATGSGPAVYPEDECKMFLRLNYCRWRVIRVLREFHERRLTADAAREVIEWERRAAETRAEIVRINVPLVLAMAKRTRITGVDFADLISEGNLALMRSVDKFDCARGFKFSTYACRAILKSFSRVAARSARYRGYFPTEFDPTLEKSDWLDRKRDGVEEECVNELKNILGSNLAKLNDVEQRVIRARFALDETPRDDEPARAKTLEQVGEMIGVTKERVRQIQNKALDKLRSILEDTVLSVQ